MWNYSFGVARESPWFGIGANTINLIPGSEKPLPGDATLTIISGHPHNWMVEILAETGFLGMTAILVTIIVTFLFLYRRVRLSKDLGSLAVIAIMAGYWGSGLFNFSFWSSWWQISFLMGFALAMVWGMRSSDLGRAP